MKTAVILATAVVAEAHSNLRTAKLTDAESHEINVNARTTALMLLNESEEPPASEPPMSGDGINENVSPAQAAASAGQDTIPLMIRALCWHPKKTDASIAGQGAVKTKYSVPSKDDYDNPANYAQWCANFLGCVQSKIFTSGGCEGGNFYKPRDPSTQGEYDVGATAEEKAAHNEAKYVDEPTEGGKNCVEKISSVWTTASCEQQCGWTNLWATDYKHKDRKKGGFLAVNKSDKRKVVERRLFAAFASARVSKKSQTLAQGPESMDFETCKKHCGSVMTQLGNCLAEPMFYPTDLKSQMRTDPYGYGLKTGTCYMSLWGYYQLTDPNQPRVTQQMFDPQAKTGCSMRDYSGFEPTFGNQGDADPLEGTKVLPSL